MFSKKGTALADSLNSPFLKINSRWNYIAYLLNTNQIVGARQQSMLMLQLGKQVGKNEAVLVAAGYLRSVYDSLGQSDSAYYYSRMESAIKDSIFNQNSINKIQALSTSIVRSCSLKESA